MNNVEVVAIGNEVLAGYTVNTNASFISQELSKRGFCVSRHVVLPDERDALQVGLRESLGRADIVIATGGLGPTFDDKTRQIVAELFGVNLYYDEDIAAKLRAKFGDVPSIKNQATIPRGAVILNNDVGTAPGFIFEAQGKMLVILPGVPLEMKSMLLKEVIFRLPREDDVYRASIYITGIPEIEVDPFLRLLQDKYPRILFGIYPSHGVLGVRLSSKERIDPAVQAIKGRFRDNIFEAETGTIEEAVQNSFIEKGLTLGLAESCTGGSIASQITKRSGSSEYFRGSVVSYSNDVKKALLGVSQESLEGHGAVSKVVVEQMALGALRVLNTDYVIAVSGIAGPSGGTPEKPVGTVWAAIAGKDGFREAWTFHSKGDRHAIIQFTVNNTLGKLWQKIHID
jgi:nicotinamide-nucleotide amidase